LRVHEVCAENERKQEGREVNWEIGKLTKNLNHLAVNFSHPKKDVINIELHHGARKNVATLRTVRTLINNLIIGVTKGFKYKMRYVYAHFPINVNVDKNSETGLFEVEIRYVVTI
jgi:large subunit ribosomal protein L9e